MASEQDVDKSEPERMNRLGNNKNVLMISQINIYGTKYHKERFIEWANENNVDVLILVESHYARENPKAKYASRIALDDDDTRVEVYIITEGLDVRSPYVSKHHVVIKLQQAKIFLDAWYVPPVNGNSRYRLEVEGELLTCLAKRRRMSIQMGDFNGRCNALNDTHEDVRGRKLVQAAGEGGYEILNMPGVMTYHRRAPATGDADGIRGQSIPDWALATADIKDRITWKAEPSVLGSDHETITLTIADVQPVKEEPKMTIKPSVFLRTFEELNTTRDPEKWWERWLQAADKAKAERKSQKVQEKWPEELEFMKLAVTNLAKSISRAQGRLDHKRPELTQLAMRYKEMRVSWKREQEAKAMARATANTLHK